MGRFVVTKDPDEDQMPEKGRFVVTKEPKTETSLVGDLLKGPAKGVLDVLSIPLLPFDMAQAGAEKLASTISGQEYKKPESGMTPGLESKRKMEFDVLDKMNRGEKPSFNELMMLSEDDEFLPQISLERPSTPISMAQEAIGETGMVGEGARRVTRSLPWLIGGPAAFSTAVRAEAGGLASSELVKAMGGGDTAQMLADIIGGIGAAGIRRTPSSGSQKPVVPLVAEQPGGFGASVEKLNPATVEKRVLSFGDDILRQAEDRISDISNQTLRDFGQFSARETEDLITRANRSNILNRVAPAEKLPKQAWEEISQAANDVFDAERKVYSGIYESVRKASQKIEYAPLEARKTALQQLQKIMNIETSPTGYSQVENIIKQVRKDLGISFENVNKPTMYDQYGNVLSGTGKEVLKEVRTPVTADKLMDLSIRLNDAINYEALTPSIKDLLKPIQRAVKEDFRRAIGKRPPVLDGFNKAEDLYKKTANRFGKDVINRLRSTENAEYLGNEFLNSSNFENLKKVFGNGSSQISAAERQLVDLIGKQGQKQAQETLRQLEPYLSPNARGAAKEFTELGDKLTTVGQRRALQQNMLSDTAEAINTGSRPNMTLTAMRTPEGYQVAKDAFGRTGQGRKLFKVLEKQVVEDMFNSITKDGRIDWNKAKQILNDPGYRQVMENIMGIDGVQFMRNIEKWSGNIVQNMAGKQFGQPASWTNFINTLDTPVKALLTLLLGSQFGVMMGIGTVAAGNYAIKGLARAMTSPIVRQTIRELGNTSIQPKELMKVANILNAEIQE